MKRQHWSTQSEEDEEEGRPAKAARSRDEETGQFDLNATPRGFDLNAPFSEEDDGQGSEWVEEKAPESDEQHKEPEEPASSILKQQFEPAASLGIDEDLDLLQNIWNAQRDSQRDDILSNLCEEIGKHPSGFPRYQYLTCFYLSKKVPSAFTLPRTYKVLLSFLDSNLPAPPNRKQSFLPVFASRLLLRAFWEEPEWPLDFVKLYLDDAVNGRTWIDNEHCKDFVLNVLTAFREDDQDIIFGDELQSYGSDTISSGKGDATSADKATVKNRYPQDELRQKARQEFLQSLHQLIKAPSSKESPRTLIRLIMLGICYEEVRVLASSMLEGWLNAPVHFRAAKVLLDRLIHHTHTTSPSDLETVANLLSCRLSPQGVGQIKTSVSNIYTDIVFQLVQRRPEYSSHALKTFLTAELGSKGSHNIKGISVVLKALSDSQSPDRELALAIKEIIVNEENAGRLQDVVLRLTKQLSREISPFLLCRALFEPWAPIEAKEEAVKEAWFRLIVDLVCKLLMQAAVPFALDENFILNISGASQNEPPKEKMLQVEAFSVKVMTFQIEALTWCTEVFNVSLPEMLPSRFSNVVQKLLFLETLQEYSLSASNSDTELNCFHFVSYCMHASEEILARIILMGIAHQFPMVPEDALSIIESMVWRAAASRNHIYGTLFADNNQLPAAIMKLSSFNLPATQQPSQIVFKDMYWRSCLIILVISVHNPATIGRSVWENSSPLRCLLQALAMGNICSSQGELNISDVFEQDNKAEETIKSLLADDSPGVASAEQWKGNVMLLSSEVKPPKCVMEELEKIDADYQLGRKIRACKNPNYLTDTVRSQDFSQAWRWVKKVVLKEPEIVGMFPCSWQSELLYMYQRTKNHSSEVLTQVQDIRNNIRKVIEENSSIEEIEQVVKFLCEKIMSPSFSVRSAGCSCALLLFGSRSTVEFIEGRPNFESTESSWLNGIDKLKAAPAILKIITPALQNALLYESSLHTVLSYVLFLGRQLPPRSFCCSVARLLVGRKVLCASLLQMPVNETKREELQVADLFLESFNKAFEDTNPDWGEANSPGLDIAGSKVPAFVVEALLMILVFTASQENDTCRKKSLYCCLLQALFPEADGSQSLFLTEAQAVQLARTKDSRLVKAGLSVLGLDDKIQLLKDLGLPVEAKACLYEELEALPDKSLERLSLLPLCERLRLSSCFTTLKTDMETSRFMKVLCSSADDTAEMDLDEPVDERSAEVEEQSAEELCQSALTGLFPQTDDQSCLAVTSRSYVPFRVLLQKAVVTKDSELIRDVFTSISSTQAGAQVKSLLLLLPVLTILLDAGTSFSEVASSLLKLMPRVGNSGPLSAAALKRIENLGNRLAEKLEESVHISSQQPLQNLEQSLQQYLILRFEGYLKRKDVVPFPSAVQDMLSRIRQYGASLSDVEVAGRYGISVAVLSILDPELASKEHLLPLICTAAPADAGESLAFTSLVLEHVVHRGRTHSLYSFAEGLWDIILRRIDLKDMKATEETCIAASLLFDFLHLSTGATCLRFGASSSQVLAALAVLSCVLETQDRKQRLFTASEVLLRACLGQEAMHAIVRQVTYMSQNEKNKQELCTAAAQLLYGLYLSYPVTIGSLLGSATVALRLPASLVASESQGSPFYNFVRQAMLSTLSNSSNVGASALCYYLARKHPVLLIQHLDSVKQFLQENVSQIKGSSNQQRISLGRTLVFTVELLDIMWPQLQSSEAEAESLLELLTQVLRALDTTDQPHFGKFVAQLSEFLSRRVVAGGGKCVELVRSQTKEVLWPAAQKFGKTKKLARLVHLLEQRGPATASSSKALNELAEMSAEKTSKVRAVLSHFSQLQLESMHESWDITKEETANDEFNLLGTLADLERASAHVPGLLTSMDDCIAGLMRNQNADVRELVYGLVGRLLQHNSCKPQLFALEILEQLKTPAPTSQLQTLIRQLPKLFYYFEEHERDILMELFRGGKATTSCLNQIVMEALSLSTTL